MCVCVCPLKRTRKNTAAWVLAQALLRRNALCGRQSIAGNDTSPAIASQHKKSNSNHPHNTKRVRLPRADAHAQAAGALVEKSIIIINHALYREAPRPPLTERDPAPTFFFRVCVVWHLSDDSARHWERKAGAVVVGRLRARRAVARPDHHLHATHICFVWFVGGGVCVGAERREGPRGDRSPLQFSRDAHSPHNRAYAPSWFKKWQCITAKPLLGVA